MAGAEELVALVKRAAMEAVDTSHPSGIQYGRVKSVNPLVITIDQRMDIPEDFLLLTDNVRDYTTKITFDNPSVKQTATTWDMGESTEGSPYKIAFKAKIEHDITVYNALKPGEGVILIRQQGGQKFIVLCRTEARK